METIYQLPTWAETILVVCVAMMMAGLAAWLACKAITEAVNASYRLEQKRRKAETKALNNWKTAYDAEHEQHINDVAELGEKIVTLERELKLKNQILAKAKVSDIG